MNRLNSTGCISAKLFPHRTNTSQWSRSSKQLYGSSTPYVLTYPVTADAMHSRAFGSMWLFDSPPFMNLFAAYPSGTVHWPDPYMANFVGAARMRFAIVSTASSQE